MAWPQSQRSECIPSLLECAKQPNESCVCVCVCECVLVAQSCPTLCDPMDCSPLGSSGQGILQGRTLEWEAILFSKGSSQPRDQTQIFYTADRFFATPNRHLQTAPWLHSCLSPTVSITSHHSATTSGIVLPSCFRNPTHPSIHPFIRC